jgi:hypothetical protein
VGDGCQGDSARGDFNGDMPGVVRPLLEWSTRLLAQPSTCDELVGQVANLRADC